LHDPLSKREPNSSASVRGGGKQAHHDDPGDKELEIGKTCEFGRDQPSVNKSHDQHVREAEADQYSHQPFGSEEI